MGEQAEPHQESSARIQAPAADAAGAAVSAGWEGRVLPANTADFLQPGKAEEEDDARRLRERRIWWGWVLGTTLTWTVLTGVVALTGRFVPAIRGQDEGWEYVLYLVGGVVQSRIIRRDVRGARWWAAVTAGAAALAVLIHLALFAGPYPLWRGAPRDWRDAAVTMLDFTLIAVAQWLWLRRRVRRAGWWLVASLVPAALLALVGFLAAAGAGESAEPAEADGWNLVFSVLIVALVMSVPAASTLIRLLRRPIAFLPGPPIAFGS